MFGLFKKKTPLQKLQEKHAALMKESFNLSKTNRSKADEKTAEANEIEKEIEKLMANG